MGTEVINVSFDVLQEELDKAKSNLRGLNDNIRRISGREPPDQLRLVESNESSRIEINFPIDSSMLRFFTLFLTFEQPK